jgi:hypothetical protein
MFDEATGGNAAPIRSIVGGTTHIGFPVALASDLAHGEVWVANTNETGPGNLVVFAMNASGSVDPLRRIAGTSTTLASPLTSVDVDAARDEVFALQRASAPMTVFSRTASGDVAPLRSLGSFDTTFAIALDAKNHEVWIAGRSGGSTNAHLFAFAETASGTDAPLRTIELSGATGDAAIGGVAIDTAHDELFVTRPIDATNGAVVVFARTSNGLDPTPLRSIVGPDLLHAKGLAIDSNPFRDTLIVVEQRTSTGPVLAFFPRAWPATSTSIAPNSSIGGPMYLQTPWGVALCE